MTGPLVVVGDALLDIDLVGTAGRLAPDSPVPVLDDLVEHPRPGGAALAALMAARDGHDVVLVTALGDDDAGARVERLLQGVRIVRLPYDGPTPVKQRVRADGQSLLRLDSGSRPGTVHGVPEEVARLLQDAAAVLVADYGRGVTAVPGLRRLLAALPQRVPLVWDPHPRGSEPVPGARLVTPNRSEAALFAERLGVPPVASRTPLGAAGRHADGLVAGWQAQAVTVTLGAGGALLSYGAGSPVVAPAPSVHCIDPCGAGDRFAVSAAVGLAAGRVTVEAVQQAVLDAAAYVAAGGPASLTADPSGTAGSPTDGGSRPVEETIAAVTRRGGTVVATGGCFDLLHAGHVATLRAARRLGDCLVVCLNSDASVRRLKGPSRPLVPAADRARVLEALECVDAVVVFDEDTPAEVLSRLRPDIWAKGGDYAGADVPEAAVLKAWGGQAVVLPYLQGRSTTGLVHTATARAALSPDRPPDPNEPMHTLEGESPMTLSAPGTVLVTGGASGLGAAVARAVLDAGGRPVILDRVEAELDVEQELVDLADTRAAEATVRAVSERVGGLDAVVTCAGTDACGRLDDVPGEDWDRVVMVNLLGTVAVVRAAMPGLLERRGRVVTVASTLGLRALSDATAYCASKFGVVGFTRALAAETQGRMGVTMLIPGGMHTAFFDGRDEQYMPPPDAKLNQPQDVAQAVLFALRQPPGCEVRELVVTPAVEGSWP